VSAIATNNNVPVLICMWY